MKSAVLALLLAACGGSDDPTPDAAGGNQSCSAFAGRVTYQQPKAWCQLALAGDDGSGGLYANFIGTGEHAVLAVTPDGEGAFKGADGSWYVHVELWPESSTLGAALHTGAVDGSGQVADACRWFVCGTVVPDQPPPMQAAHPW